MQDLRLGIIGLGNMGQFHANAIAAGKIAHCRLAAVCDRDERQLVKCLPARGFLSSSELITSGEVDAVLIATPHYSHTTIGIEALDSGLHVLIKSLFPFTKPTASVSLPRTAGPNKCSRRCSISAPIHTT